MKRDLLEIAHIVLLAVLFVALLATSNVFGQTVDEQRTIARAKADAVWQLVLAREAAEPGPANQNPPDPAPERGEHKCACGPNCKCEGECHCEWPGQCMGIKLADFLDVDIQKFHDIELESGTTTTAGQVFQSILEPSDLQQQIAELNARHEALADKYEYLRQQPQSEAPQPSSPPATPLAGPVRAAALSWLDSDQAGWRQSKETGKPAIIYWSGQSCAPCRRFERDVMDDAQVREFLSENFVCVKVDAERAKNTGKYGIRAIPTVQFIDPQWKHYYTLERTNDPQEFIRLLQARLYKATDGTAAKPAINRQRVAIRYAVRTTPAEDQGQYASAEVQELDPPANWQPRATAARYTSGSAGGWGGASRVVYVQSAPSYGSAGGYGSSGGFGGAGSNGGGYGWSGYSQPYYAPRSYYQPTYYSGWSGGGSIVCGPGGCLLAAVGGAVFFMYANYQRNKKKIVRAQKEVDHLYAHLGIPKPVDPAPVERRY